MKPEMKLEMNHITVIEYNGLKNSKSSSISINTVKMNMF